MCCMINREKGKGNGPTKKENMKSYRKKEGEEKGIISSF